MMQTLFYFLIIAASSQARTFPEPRCYEIPMAQPQLAEAESGHSESTHNEDAYTETWCYQDIDAPRTGLFIYNIDHEKIRPELSMIRDENGELTHGSLTQGKITYHKVNSNEYNPFSIPLNEPTSLSVLFISPSAQALRESQRILSNLLRVHDAQTPADLTLIAGHIQASTDYKPWRGYWWPQRGQSLAPTLRKYDNVLRLNGQESAAVSWEASKHAWGGASWEGHCNGWAAASIMRAEPRTTRFHSGEEFSVGNQKGLLAEKDYCAKAAFFGGRTAVNGEVHAQFISAKQFHTTLQYYIGNLRKPIAMDYRATSAVDNHVVSGYNMNIEDLGNGRLRVTNVLTMHKYDGKNTDAVGIAPDYLRTYKYILVTDANKTIVSGEWISGNPDFIWVPLSTSTCPKGNSYVTEDWVQAIIYR